jgi:hypothetical protein
MTHRRNVARRDHRASGDPCGRMERVSSARPRRAPTGCGQQRSVR